MKKRLNRRERLIENFPNQLADEFRWIGQKLDRGEITLDQAKELGNMKVDGYFNTIHLSKK